MEGSFKPCSSKSYRKIDHTGLVGTFGVYAVAKIRQHYGHRSFLKNSQIWAMYRVKEYININKENLSGNPIFKGTRVPIQTLFDHLEKGLPLNEFLDDFPKVRKEQAIAVIEIAGKIMTSKNIEQIYETAA